MWGKGEEDNEEGEEETVDDAGLSHGDWKMSALGRI